MLAKLTLDGWSNFITGLGQRGRDKSAHNQFTTPRDFTQIQLEDLYRGDAIATRIVDALPADGLRQWISLKIGAMAGGDAVSPEDSNRIAADVLKSLRSLKLRRELKRATRWDRLYGGAILFMAIDDGLNPSDPVDLNRIRRISSVKAIHRYRATKGPLVTDVDDTMFGRPQYFDLMGGDVSLGVAAGVRIHGSRCLLFESVDLPDDVRRRRSDSWSDSIYVRVWDALSEFQVAYRSTGSLLADFSQAIWSIPHLADKIAMNGKDDLMLRYSIMDFVRGITNMVMLDATEGEAFERKTTNVTGLDGLLDRHGVRLAAAAGMPITKILGIEPSGFAKEDVSGDNNYDDAVKDWQEDVLRDELERLLEIQFAAKEGPTGGVVPSDWVMAFNDLTQRSEKEQAELEKTVAEKDAMMIDRGVLMPDEVSASRYTATGFSIETTLDQDARDEEDPESDATPLAGGAAEVQALIEQVIAGKLPVESAVVMLTLSWPVSEKDARAIIEPAAALAEKEKAAAEERCAAMPAAMQSQMDQPFGSPPESDAGDDGEGGEESSEERSGGEQDRDGEQEHEASEGGEDD